MSVGIVHLRSTHVPVQGAHWTFCAVCDDTWPCPVINVLASLDAAEAARDLLDSWCQEMTGRAEKAEAAIARVRALCNESWFATAFGEHVLTVGDVEEALDGSDD